MYAYMYAHICMYGILSSAVTKELAMYLRWWCVCAYICICVCIHACKYICMHAYHTARKHGGQACWHIIYINIHLCMCMYAYISYCAAGRWAGALAHSSGYESSVTHRDHCLYWTRTCRLPRLVCVGCVCMCVCGGRGRRKGCDKTDYLCMWGGRRHWDM